MGWMRRIILISFFFYEILLYKACHGRVKGWRRKRDQLRTEKEAEEQLEKYKMNVRHKKEEEEQLEMNKLKISLKDNESHPPNILSSSSTSNTYGSNKPTTKPTKYPQSEKNKIIDSKNKNISRNKNNSLFLQDRHESNNDIDVNGTDIFLGSSDSKAHAYESSSSSRIEIVNLETDHTGNVFEFFSFFVINVSRWLSAFASFFFTVIKLSGEPSTSIVEHNRQGGSSLSEMYVFVAVLSRDRAGSLREFNKTWVESGIWKELTLVPVEAFRHPTRGLGCTLSHIVALERAIDMNIEIGVFFEEDAIPFNNHSVSESIVKMLTHWHKDSPVLFLGAHHMVSNTHANIDDGVTYVTRALGTYGYMVRKQHFQIVVDSLRNDLTKAKKAYSPDVIISSITGNNRSHCAVATPLLVDHPSGKFSVNWGHNRPISNWEGQSHWWKIKYKNDKISRAEYEKSLISKKEPSYFDTNDTVLSDDEVNHLSDHFDELSLFHLVHTGAFGLREQRCIEAIFYHYPQAKVLIHSTSFLEKAIQPLLAKQFYIKIHDINLEHLLSSIQLLDKVSIDNFIKHLKEYSGQKYWKNNYSNLVRLIVVYLYGGTYIDTDVIISNDYGIDKVYNGVGREDENTTFINNAVLWNFVIKNNFIKQCLIEFFRQYNGNKWGNNGPRLITKVEKVFSRAGTSCKENEVDSDLKQCSVTVLNSSAFQFVPYKKIPMLYFENTNQTEVSVLWQHLTEHSYAVHLNSHATSPYFIGKLGGHTKNGTVARFLLNSFCVIDCDAHIL